MDANPLLGVGHHAIGAFSAASCYTPMKRAKTWAWEIYWLVQATFAWCIFPIVGAFLTVPDLAGFLARAAADDALRSSLRESFLWGAAYATGGLSFGLGVRYIGFSLNYSIAIGISAALGTLLEVLRKGKADALFRTTPGLIVLSGMTLSLVGIAVCGCAGWLRERASAGTEDRRFSFARGVPLAIVAGLLSAVFSQAISAGDPLAEAARDAGAPEVLKYNPVYIFAMGGTWVVNVLWCVLLAARGRTFGQLVRLPGGARGLPMHYLMAVLTGAMWYLQFFFYGMGHTSLGESYGFTSWAIHMALLILFSNLIGKLFREWEGATTLPRKLVHCGMALIVAAAVVITYGNWLGAR